MRVLLDSTQFRVLPFLCVERLSVQISFEHLFFSAHTHTYQIRPINKPVRRVLCVAE